jgi:hypothetical protein
MRLALIMAGVPLLLIGTALMQSEHRLYGVLPMAAGAVALAAALLSPRRGKRS